MALNRSVAALFANAAFDNPQKTLALLHSPVLFDGLQKSWVVWKNRVRAVLTGASCLSMIDSLDCDCVGEEATLKYCIVCRGVFSYIYRCLPDSLTPLSFGLPNHSVPVYSVSGLVKSEPSLTSTSSSTGGSTSVVGNKQDAASMTTASTSVQSKSIDLECPHPASLWMAIKSKYEANTSKHRRIEKREFEELKMKADFDLFVCDIENRAARLIEMKRTVTDEDKLDVLFSGLPNCAEELVATLENDRSTTYSKAVPVLKDFFSRRAAASSRGGGTSNDDIVIASASTSEMRTGPRGGCWNCGDSRHVKANCPKLQQRYHNQHHGAKRFGERHVWNKKQNRAPIRCWSCKQVGHKADECKSKRQEHSSSFPQSRREGDGSNSDTFMLVVTSGDPAEKNDSNFYIDSAADLHVANDIRLFDRKSMTKLDQPLPIYGIFKNQPSGYVQCVGCVDLRVNVGGVIKSIRLSNVAYLPTARCNLISVCALVSRELSYEEGRRANGAGDWRCYTQSGALVMTATRVGRRLKLDLADASSAPAASSSAPVCVCAASSPLTMSLWHQRLAHLNPKSLQRLISSDAKASAATDMNTKVGDCDACVLGKMTRKPFPKHSDTRAVKPLEVVHSDVKGPIGQKGRYVVTFVDDHSRYVCAYIIKAKSDVTDKFKDYFNYWTTRFKLPLGCLHSDNGGEYLPQELKEFCTLHGIKTSYTLPGSPQENGIAERMNRTIFDKARAMIEHAGAPAEELWEEAVRNAIHIINLSPASANDGESPAMRWEGIQRLCGVRVFGCLAWAHCNQGPLEPRAVRCVYVGIDPQRKGWRLWCLKKKKVIVSRDVVFRETVFPFKKSEEKSEMKFSVDDDRVDLFDDDCAGRADPLSVSSEIVVPPQASPPSVAPGATEPLPALEDDNESVAGDDDGDEDEQLQVEHKANEQLQPGAQQEAKQPAAAVQREHRSNFGQPPQRLHPYVVHSVSLPDPEPTSYKEAMQGPDASKWKAAAQQEIDVLQKKGTWSLVDLPPGREAISNKWVLRVKYNADGSIEKFKARLVARGFEQEPGKDYDADHITSPVGEIKSLRVLLAIAAIKNWSLRQLDVVSAFLNGTIDEELYMRQPEGFDDRSGRVCKLRKALYGLKQASKNWNKAVHRVLLSIGFVQFDSERCVYIYSCGADIVVLWLYVDDMVLASNNNALIDAIIAQLAAHFELKDRGEASWVLGLHITRDKKAGTISVDQSKYIQDMLSRYRMHASKPVRTPAVKGEPLRAADSPSTEEEIVAMSHVPYKSAVGSLLHAANGTRPDISWAVGDASRFNATPGKAHWMAVKRILRYLKGTASKCIRYTRPPQSSSSDPIIVRGYADASWASIIDSRRSWTGVAFFIADGVTLWASRAQPTVALSTAEAEYMALSAAGQEVKWLSSFLSELGVCFDISVFVDNISAIHLAEGHTDHSRTKHIDIRHHFVRDMINEGVLKVEWISGENMVADILTKPLDFVTHERHASRLLH